MVLVNLVGLTWHAVKVTSLRGQNLESCNESHKPATQSRSTRQRFCPKTSLVCSRAAPAKIEHQPQQVKGPPRSEQCKGTRTPAVYVPSFVAHSIFPLVAVRQDKRKTNALKWLQSRWIPAAHELLHVAPCLSTGSLANGGILRPPCHASTNTKPVHSA